MNFRPQHPLIRSSLHLCPVGSSLKTRPRQQVHAWPRGRSLHTEGSSSPLGQGPSGCGLFQKLSCLLFSLHAGLSTHSALCGIAQALLHSLLYCITSFLPFLYAWGTLSLQPPFLSAYSLNHELGLLSLSSLSVSLEAILLYFIMLRIRIEAH